MFSSHVLTWHDSYESPNVSDTMHGPNPSWRWCGSKEGKMRPSVIVRELLNSPLIFTHLFAVRFIRLSVQRQGQSCKDWSWPFHQPVALPTWWSEPSHKDTHMDVLKSLKTMNYVHSWTWREGGIVFFGCLTPFYILIWVISASPYDPELRNDLVENAKGLRKKSESKQLIKIKLCNCYLSCVYTWHVLSFYLSQSWYLLHLDGKKPLAFLSFHSIWKSIKDEMWLAKGNLSWISELSYFCVHFRMGTEEALNGNFGILVIWARRDDRDDGHMSWR